MKPKTVQAVIVAAVVAVVILYLVRDRGGGGKWGSSPSTDVPPGFTGGQPGGGPGL